MDLVNLLWRRWTIDILQLAYEISQDIAVSAIQYIDTSTPLLVTQLNTFQKVFGFPGRLLSVVSATRMDTLWACSACKVSIITHWFLEINILWRDTHFHLISESEIYLYLYTVLYRYNCVPRFKAENAWNVLHAFLCLQNSIPTMISWHVYQFKINQF